MIATETFENILLQIQNSNLNFKLNLSPFAANISLKKSLVKDKSGIPLLPRTNAPTCDNLAVLAAKNQQLKNELFYAENKFASTVKECETAVHQELRDSRELINKLPIVNADLMEENEVFKNKIRNLETEIKDLEHSNKLRKEVSENLNKKLSELKINFNKEKMDIAKRNKLEVKYWRKELGEETKVKIKLREMLEHREKGDEDTTKKMSKKKSLNKKTKSSTYTCRWKDIV